MAKLLSTIWALLLNTFGVSIFQTCFANSIEDEDGEPLLTGPPVTAFLFAVGVYTVIVKFNLFPQSLRQPNPTVLLLYEVSKYQFRVYFFLKPRLTPCILQFLVAAFMLEFAVACIWTPVDIMIITTIPKILCKVHNDSLLPDISKPKDIYFHYVFFFFFARFFVSRGCTNRERQSLTSTRWHCSATASLSPFYSSLFMSPDPQISLFSRQLIFISC